MFLSHGAPQRHKHSVIKVQFLSSQKVSFYISLTSTPSYSFHRKINFSLNLYIPKNCEYELIYNIAKLFVVFFFKGKEQLWFTLLNFRLSLQIRNSLRICFLSRNSSKFRIHPHGNRQCFHKQWNSTLLQCF